MARAELASQILLLAPASDRDASKPSSARELDPEVPEAADPEDGDEVAAGSTAVRNALKVVIPAQTSGAASSWASSSGIDASALLLTTT